MGKPAARVGDLQSGHQCFPPSSAVVGSQNVKINGQNAMMVGGMYQTHCCPKKGCHPPIQSSGSSTVFINGVPASALGDSTTCGSVTISGSVNVLIGE